VHAMARRRWAVRGAGAARTSHTPHMRTPHTRNARGETDPDAARAAPDTRGRAAPDGVGACPLTCTRRVREHARRVSSASTRRAARRASRRKPPMEMPSSCAVRPAANRPVISRPCAAHAASHPYAKLCVTSLCLVTSPRALRASSTRLSSRPRQCPVPLPRSAPRPCLLPAPRQARQCPVPACALTKPGAAPARGTVLQCAPARGTGPPPVCFSARYWATSSVLQRAVLGHLQCASARGTVPPRGVVLQRAAVQYSSVLQRAVCRTRRRRVGYHASTV
jgi:hypothetical protein